MLLVETKASQYAPGTVQGLEYEYDLFKLFNKN